MYFVSMIFPTLIVMICSFVAYSGNEALEYTPVNVNGYVYDNGIEKDHNPYNDAYHSSNPRVQKNIEMIHKKYSTFLPQIEENLNNDNKNADEQPITRDAKTTYKINNTPIIPMQFSTSAVEKICNDIGYDEKSQRASLKLHECVAKAIKVKFTEETINHQKYNTIDSNIANAMKQHTFVDNSIKNLMAYQEMLNYRNKMACINSYDYNKCINTTVEYKKCYNASYETTIIEHEQNKIICYIKTGIRFSTPNMEISGERDSYFGMCMYLIEKDMQKKINKMNIGCNEILTKNNFMDLSI